MEIGIYNSKHSHKVKDFVLSILEDEFGHKGVERPDLVDINGFYKTGGGNFWIACKDGEIVGTVGLNIYKKIGYLKRMIISKEYRG